MLTKKLAERICREIASGKSLTKVCEGKGMPSVQTVLNWRDRHEWFVEAYIRAREARAERLVDEILEIADNEPDPQRARVRVETRKWIACKYYPKMYGDPPPNAQTQQNITVVLADLAGEKPKVIEATSNGIEQPLLEQK